MLTTLIPKSRFVALGFQNFKLAVVCKYAEQNEGGLLECFRHHRSVADKISFCVRRKTGNELN